MDDNLITIEQLTKTFITEKGKEVKALLKTDIAVKKNDFVCIVGPSGCGKSTLLRIIAGLEQATSGQVLYNKRKQTRPNREIGMVFQQYSLLPWKTVEENITLGLDFGKVNKAKKNDCANHFLKMIGMESFRHAYPYEISGGMQQRVAIARALANDPQVLLMDEPFGALDAYTRILMQEELLKIWEQNKKTVLFVTHSVDEAIYLADRIVVMSSRPGKIEKIIPVNMPRPRDRADSSYGKLSSEIFSVLEAGSNHN